MSNSESKKSCGPSETCGGPWVVPEKASGNTTDPPKPSLRIPIKAGDAARPPTATDEKAGAPPQKDYIGSAGGSLFEAAAKKH